MRLICFLALLITMFIVSDVDAQRPYRRYRNPYPTIAYSPQVEWYFEGTNFNVTRATVTPCRRYVIIGVNANFTRISGVQTYNLRSRYPYRR